LKGDIDRLVGYKSFTNSGRQRKTVKGGFDTGKDYPSGFYEEVYIAPTGKENLLTQVSCLQV